MPAGVTSFPLTSQGQAPLAGRLPWNEDVLRRYRYAEALLQRGAETGPVKAHTEGLNRVAQSLVGALLAREATAEQKTREKSYGETLSKALSASQPEIAGNDLYAMDAGVPKLPGTMGPMPAEPTVRAGQPMPGTGGMEAMMSALAGNPDTAPLGLQLQSQQLLSRQKLADELAAKTAAERLFLSGRGNPSYLGEVATAQRPPVAYEADVAAARREPIDKAGLRAEQVAAGTARGQGQSRLMTDAEVKAAGLPPGTYQRDPSGKVTEVGKPTAAHEDAINLGLAPGSEEYKDYIRKRTTEKPAVTIDMGEKAEVEKVKALARVHEARLKTAQEQIQGAADLEPRLEAIVLGLESGRVDTGIIREALFPLRQALKDAGFTIDPNLPQAEQVRAAMSYIAPRMRVIGSGQTSNFELREFRKAGPQYSNTTEGNVLLGRSFLQIQNRNRRAYDLMLRYYEDKGTLAGFEEQADAALGPVFPRPKDATEHGELTPGTVYYHTELKKFMVKR